jgi:hypothetical protein
LLDSRERGHLGGEPAAKVVERLGRSLNLDLDIGNSVLNVAGQAQVAGQVEYKRAKPNSLNGPMYC